MNNLTPGSTVKVIRVDNTVAHFVFEEMQHLIGKTGTVVDALAFYDKSFMYSVDIPGEDEPWMFRRDELEEVNR